jgi:hypothetical protein
MPQNIIAIKIAQSAILAAASTVVSGVSIAIRVNYSFLKIRFKTYLIMQILAKCLAATLVIQFWRNLMS